MPIFCRRWPIRPAAHCYWVRRGFGECMLMKFLWNSAFGLLLITGSLLGLTLPFGKLATAGGVPAMLWAFVISGGAGSVLLAALLLLGHRPKLTGHTLRFFFLAAAI